MKKFILLPALLIVAFTVSCFMSKDGGGYEIGDKAADFKLKNIDGNFVSMKDYEEAKGFVVIFTCNHCPYSKAYEDRIIAIDKKYKEKGFPVIAINPNDPAVSPGDSFEDMKVRAREKNFTFPYLFDEKQEIYPVYGATKTPHVYVLNKEKEGLMVRYIGAIDDNYGDASAVERKYLEKAIDVLLEGNVPDPDHTKAIGCSIKAKG